MKDWYERYYTAIQHSAAYSEFCTRVFGRNLGQHGFSDMDQVQLLIDALDIHPDDRLLDLGCGIGGILNSVASSTGAFAVGVDYIEQAVTLAHSRYANPRLQYVATDIGSLCFNPGSFDIVISIDTLYFNAIPETIAVLRELITPNGRMGLLYSHGADPDNPLPTFDRGELPSDRTPLGVALSSHSLAYTATDLTEPDYKHALLKKSVLEELHSKFVDERNEFLYENRYGEANGVMAAIDAGAHARYLYIVTKTGK